MINRGAGSLMRGEGDCVRTPRTGKVGKRALIPSGYPAGLSVGWASFDTSGYEGFLVNKVAEGKVLLRVPMSSPVRIFHHCSAVILINLISVLHNLGN